MISYCVFVRAGIKVAWGAGGSMQMSKGGTQEGKSRKSGDFVLFNGVNEGNPHTEMTSLRH